MAAQFGLRETRADYRDMLSRDDIDAAIVLTQPSATYEVADGWVVTKIDSRKRLVTLRNPQGRTLELSPPSK